RLSEIASALKMILRSIGEDPERERLLQTPERFARAVLHLTCGYDMSPKVAINGAKFNRDYHDVALAHNATTGCSNVVLVKNIEIASLCEHHFLPFTGKAHIGYIPRDEVLGISKLARIAEIYARRLQIQERLTQQVADAIQSELGPHGVVVVIKCSHMCMSMRGTRQTDATTTTQYTTGVFRTETGLIEQFLKL
ncbi:hypothetical protein M433DRAFT_54004, partial [Acidomyces richmondensis BFW]